MSENVNWKVLPWEWQKLPEWWVERIRVYFGAKVEVMPILQAKHRRRMEQQ